MGQNYEDIMPKAGIIFKNLYPNGFIFQYICHTFACTKKWFKERNWLVNSIFKPNLRYMGIGEEHLEKRRRENVTDLEEIIHKIWDYSHHHYE